MWGQEQSQATMKCKAYSIKGVLRGDKKKGVLG
jgi:hypothetical protein